MSTWHQQQSPVPLWHATKWTLVDDTPGKHTCVERFEAATQAYEAMQKRGGYVIRPTAAAHDLPLAAAGLTSYRCKGRYGWIMIGAKDHDDAMREARRSSSDVTEAGLEIWDGERYVPVVRAGQEPFAAVLERAIACSGE
ncbi:MAG: hypothetical protein M3O74_13820 [Pseudomonadota bacterium]|nr:hypothetical protein [Pseudomonadota bacterium]